MNLSMEFFSLLIFLNAVVGLLYTEGPRITQILRLEKKSRYAKFALVELHCSKDSTNVEIPHLRVHT